MNKIVIIVVFIFWAAVSFFFAKSLFDKDSVSASNNNLETANDQLPSNTLTGQAFTVDLIAQHNTATDCWVTYGNTVYNVTDYLSSHPGGRDRIIPYCGTDIATAFMAQGHSNVAASMLNGLAIGTIGQAVVSTSPTNLVVDTSIINNVPITPTPPASGQTLTLALVSQHNTASDCWVTYGNTVYSVTNYLNTHPGGRSRIIPYCGADIAAAFAAQGHSNSATSILNGLAIGTIGQAISSDPNTITPPPVNNSDDDEEEDDD